VISGGFYMFKKRNSATKQSSTFPGKYFTFW